MSNVENRLRDAIEGVIDDRKRRAMRNSGIIGMRENGTPIVSARLRSNRREERERRRAERVRRSRPTIRPARPRSDFSRSETRRMNRRRRRRGRARFRFGR